MYGVKPAVSEHCCYFLVIYINCMMQCTQCSCHAPSGGQQIQQLVGRSDFKCMIEHSGRYVKELEILRHFQTWGCLYKAWGCSRSRKESAEIREREPESVRRRNVCCLRGEGLIKNAFYVSRFTFQKPKMRSSHHFAFCASQRRYARATWSIV